MPYAPTHLLIEHVWTQHHMVFRASLQTIKLLTLLVDSDIPVLCILWLDNFNPYCVLQQKVGGVSGNPLRYLTVYSMLVSLVGPLVSLVPRPRIRREKWPRGLGTRLGLSYETLNFELWASSPTLRDCSSVCCSHVFCGLSQKLLLKEVLTPTFCLVSEFQVVQFAWVLPVETNRCKLW